MPVKLTASKTLCLYIPYIKKSDLRREICSQFITGMCYLIDGWKGGWMDGWMHGWMDRNVDGWMDVWKGGWMDAWMDG